LIRKTVIRLTTIQKFRHKDAEKLRGYFLNICRENNLFHNHDEKSRSIYRMPLIQYKVENKQFVIVGLSNATEVIIKEFLKISTIFIDGKKIKVEKSELNNYEEDLKVDDKLYKYKFRTMWLPITQRNFQAYKNGNLDLNIVLRNNILTNFKGFGIEAKKNIMVNGNYKQHFVSLKNKKMIGFYGNFVSNTVLPELIGIGQRRAIGFGDIIRLD